MKLTTNQIMALNMVDRLRIKASEMDLDDNYTALDVAQAFSEEEIIQRELEEYKKTGNRDCLKQAKNDLIDYHEIFTKAVEEWKDDTQVSPIQNLINKYTERCNKILEESTVNGEFDYNCDADDQVLTAEAETEYYTLLNVIEDLKKLV